MPKPLCNRVLILGLDCAVPELVFERWRPNLPALDTLMQRGTWGPLQSCVPPITIPAWTCMLSGKSPGSLGCYGFRNRSDHSYEGLRFATARSITADRLWDILGRHNRRVIVQGVPQTYPPAPVNGIMVSGFLTPDTSCTYTFPPALAGEIKDTVGEYLIDVEDFRSDDKESILRQVYAITDQHFQLFSRFLQTRPWECAMYVEMGIDRMQHAFWSHMDPRHPRHCPGSPYADALFDYYRHVDRRIGELLHGIDDQTAVLVVSDHGARPMLGGFCINEWLQREGFLHLADRPDTSTPFRTSAVDWPRTRAWSEGGYYARVFLNVRGREPEGTIAPEDYERVRSQLYERLHTITRPDGSPLPVQVFRPEDIYPRVEGIAPDLIVYFDDLAWRAIGSVGMPGLHTCENDIGPDDANHARDGICIMAVPGHAPGGQRAGMRIIDIAPTVLALMGIPVPPDMEGTAIAP